MTNKQDIQTLHAQVVSMSAILSQMLVRLNTMLSEPDETHRTEPFESIRDLMQTEGGTRVPAIAVAPVAPKPELILNDEWRHVLDVLENGTGHVFVTGGAGTGKSTLLEHFIATTNKVAAVVAPSGVAAIRVHGMTIHRMFGFGAHAQQKGDVVRLEDSRRAKYKALEVLIIDEASMVRADLMDAISEFLSVNGRHEGQPFGGCRVVMFGDLFQLPPVVRSAPGDNSEKQWLTTRYGTECPYMFHAEVWRDAPIKVCELTTIFRQSDRDFTDALNAFRNGEIKPEHLALLNKRADAVFMPPPDETWITLVTTNDAAAQINKRMLDRLKTPSQFFEASVSAGFDLKDAPNDPLLELKIGAAVMFIRNDKDNRWHNGTLGRVTAVGTPDEPLLEVETDNGLTVDVMSEKWEQIEYEHDKKTNRLKKKVKGTFEQVPVKMAAAITIHKSQGLTLEHVIIDLGGRTFAAGQGYVALSRCRTLAGTVLRRPVRKEDFIVSSEVIKFMRNEPIARPVPVAAQVDMFEEGHTNAIPSLTD